MKGSLEIYNLLVKRYPVGECVILQEVSDSSGFARSRSLDWMVVNLWPSRGLSIIGIEMKSWRGDWLKERKNPKKQENHFQYCDYFYLLTTEPNVAKLDEIPETWGWLEIKGNIIKVMKEAPKQNPVTVDRGFLCAMLRRAASKDHWVHEDSIADRISVAEENAKRYTQDTLDRANKELDMLRRKIIDFEKASGVVIGSYRYENDQAKIGQAVKFVLDGGVTQYELRLKELKQSTSKILSDVAKALEDLKLIEKKETV